MNDQRSEWIDAAARGFAEGLIKGAVGLETEPGSTIASEMAGHLVLADGKGTVVSLDIWRGLSLVAKGYLLTGREHDQSRQEGQPRKHPSQGTRRDRQPLREIEITIDEQLWALALAIAKPSDAPTLERHVVSSSHHPSMWISIYQPDRARAFYHGYILNNASQERLSFHFEPRIQPGRVKQHAAYLSPWIIVIPIVWAVICAGAVIADLIQGCLDRATAQCGEAGVKSVITKIKTGIFGCSVECVIQCYEPGDDPEEPTYEGTFPDAG